jgi:copper chaperone CopZ
MKKTNDPQKRPLGFLLIALLLAFALNASAQKTPAYVYIKVQVDGLACPFCAYGLEKKIKKMKGSSDINIDIQQGFVFFRMPKENEPTEEALRKLVKDAGFTAREIKISNAPFPKTDV